jgi:hypothetical protein
MVIHTFGDYARFHPHLHAIVADGLFRKSGSFYVLPRCEMKQLEEIFRSSILAMLKRKGKIADDLIGKLMNWRHSGFSVYAGNRIARDDKAGQEALAQYIMRNAFAEEKITYIENTGQVLYRSDMTHGKNKKNFELLPAGQFIARVTQHIPEKGFQMVRYYGWYSNRAKGRRRKEGMLRPGDKPPEKEDSVNFTILDISDYEPPRAPSKTWRELIKKVWEIDPLTCPRCGSEMRIISLIQDPDVIRRILEHLGLWRQDTGSRCKKPKPEYGSVVHEDFDDGWPGYEEPTITSNSNFKSQF